MRHTALWLCTHIPNKYYLNKNKKIDLEVKGHYGTQHTALWSCTHIPNIIDLSGKTKKLWSGQASLRRSGRRRRRSGRKNQTITIYMSPFIRRGDIIISPHFAVPFLSLSLSGSLTTSHKESHSWNLKKKFKGTKSVFFRKWPFSGEDDRGKTSPRALVFTCCDIQSERLYQKKIV